MIVTAEKISKGSYFRLLFTSILLGFFFFFLLCGIAAVFGAQTVSWNGQYVTGVNGLFSAMLMWPFFSLFFSCFLWLFGSFGLWIYSFYKPLRVKFKGIVETQETDA